MAPHSHLEAPSRACLLGSSLRPHVVFIQARQGTEVTFFRERAKQFFHWQVGSEETSSQFSRITLSLPHPEVQDPDFGTRDFMNLESSLCLEFFLNVRAWDMPLLLSENTAAGLGVSFLNTVSKHVKFLFFSFSFFFFLFVSQDTVSLCNHRGYPGTHQTDRDPPTSTF